MGGVPCLIHHQFWDRRHQRGGLHAHRRRQEKPGAAAGISGVQGNCAVVQRPVQGEPDYARIIYDSLASLLTFCTFAAASEVTSARLNCSAGDKLWCPLSALGVFFAFMLSISFMISLFTGSYVSFREHRMKAVVSSIVK